MVWLLKDPSLDRADRVQLYMAYAMQLILLVASVLAILETAWLTAFLAAFAFLMTLLPALIRRSFRVYLPLEFDFLFILFTFASLFLGEMRSYYARFWWWDVVLHTSAGMLMGILGFALVYILNRHERINVVLSPAFVALFSFSFAQAIGVIWEIFEFGMDSIFGMNMQKTGVVDTMWDLIVNTAGALIVSVAGFFYVRGGDSLVFDRIVRRFLERNRMRA
ncbi:MAG: hypothetical protein ACOCSK_02350 [Rhodothermales bacterium]